MREVERVMLLRAVDSHWMDHIDAMDQLRQGIGLQAIAQKDPVVAYRNAGFDMFDEMVVGIRERTVRTLFHVSVRTAPQTREQLAKPVETSGDTKPQPKRADKNPAGMTPAPAAVGKSTKTAAGAANSAGSRLKIKGNPKNKEGCQRAKLSRKPQKINDKGSEKSDPAR